MNTFPLENREEAKYDRLQHEMTNHYDILGITETNYNWYQMESHEQPHNQTRTWWKNKTIQKGWLKTKEYDVKFQVGGTMTIATNKNTSYILDKGEEAKDLGRWTWITVANPQHTIKTTIITAYVPCNSRGEFTTYSQQIKKLRNDYPKKTKGVYETYIKDLDDFITTKQNQRNQIILMGDFNEDTRDNGRIKKLIAKHNMYNPIEERYGKTTTTYAYGTSPIDAIFISNNLSIKQGGHQEGDLTLSDHKVVWIDIAKEQIMGNNEPIIYPKQRILHTSHPKVRKKYNKLLESHLQKHNVPYLMKQLKNKMKENDKQQSTQLYEKLARIRLQGVQYAEKHCRPPRGGNIPFSPEIKNAMGAITMWKLIYKRHLSSGKYKPSQRMLYRKAKKWNFPLEQLATTNPEVIKQELTQAVNHYKTVRQSATERRHAFLVEKANAMAEEKGTNAKKHLIHLIRLEEQKEMYQHIKHAQKKNQQSSLTFVEEDMPDGSRRRITDKNEMERSILTANLNKLTQANNTPLREEPLCSLFNEDKLDYDQWKKVLDPNFQLPEGLERGTRLWFRQMRRKDTTIPPSTMEMTTEQYRDSWKSRKENTSAHPGLHFGNYKSLQFTNETNLAGELFTLLANMPLVTGYSPKEWRQCTDAMLQKKKKDNRAAKLRLITLKDVGCNHNNVLIGRRMMQNGEKHNTFATEQYGSRKQKSAIEHALNKVLTLDISRQKGEDMIFTANDAVSCYDRIVLLAAYLSMIKYGIPEESAQSAITTLAEMEHYIRTAYGDSIQTYGGDTWIRIPHGIGQGNGAGPPIWACVSTPLFEAMREDGYGSTFTSPITLLLLNITGFAFVDDADLIQTKGNLKSDKDLFIKAQAQLIIWEQLLRTTGGAIAPDKSDWVFIRYRWEKGEKRYNYKKFNHNMIVRDKDKQELPLQQLNIKEARETLGVWIAGDCNWRTQHEKLQEKANIWAENTFNSNLSPTTAGVAVKTTIMKTLDYCLPATYMSKTQCKKITNKLLWKTLPKLKVARTISREVVHLPVEYKGLGINCLEEQQGIAHIKMLLRHGGTQTATGILIQTTMEYFALEVGCVGSVFNTRSSLLTLATPTWIRHTLQFMHKYNISITHHEGQAYKWHLQDRSIMSAIDDKPYYNTREMKAINRCRIYLQVITLSDITTTEGALIPQALTLVKYNSHSSMAYDWPYQPRPIEEDIKLWKHALTTNLGLRTHIGRTSYQYKGHNEIAAFVNDWRYDPDTTHLWKKKNNVWQRFITHGRTRQSTYQPTSDTISYSKRSWQLAITGTTRYGMTLVTTAPHHKEPAPPESTWLPVGNIREGPALNQLLEAIKTKTARSASDGSAKDGCTATAYTTIGPYDTPPVEGSFKIPGRYEEQDSYRSELAGILAIMTVINLLCFHHRIHEGKMTVGCDNKSALLTALQYNSVDIKRSSRDILQGIHYQRKISPIEWEGHHVKGHQDEDKDIMELDDWAKANVRCDQQAKAALQADTPAPQHSILAGEKWRLIINEQVVTGNYDQSLLLHCNHEKAITYWSGRGQFNAQYAHLINWKAHQKGFKALTSSEKLHITKLYSGVQTVGKVMHRRGLWTEPTCKFCDEIETHQHLLQCRSPQGQHIYQQAFNKLDDWVEKQTSAEIGQAIWSLFDAYRNKETEVTPWPTWPPILQDTYEEQWKLGRRSFVEGYLTLKWVQCQEQYLTTLPQKDRKYKTGQNWAKQLSTRIWRMQHHIWTQRCEAVHGREITEKEAKLNLDGQLHHYLTQSPPLSMPADDRRYWIPLDKALKYHPRRKKRLIDQLKTFITAHNKRTNTKSAQLMRLWLADLPPD